MDSKVQVDPGHYQFDRYMDTKRWMSIWHQVNAILYLKPSRVLEIGPGSGIFTRILRAEGIDVTTVDIDPSLKPDYIASATQLPFADASYDVVCAFQVLEHLPFPQSLQCLGEFARVARETVTISVPHSGPSVRLSISIPKIGSAKWLWRIPIPKRLHHFDGEHYWEIGKRGYGLAKVRREFSAVEGLKYCADWQIQENPFHRFFSFDKYSTPRDP